MMVNPYTAEVLPEIKGREFFQFVQQLHRNLTVGPVGKQITGACTLMLIFSSCLACIYAGQNVIRSSNGWQ